MDYRRCALTILLAVTVSGMGTGAILGGTGRDQVLNGQVLDATGSGAAVAVRLRCPGFQSQTWTTQSGHFTFRMPPLAETLPRPASRTLDRRPREDFFSDSRTGATLDCTLQILESETSVAQFELAIPSSRQQIDLGALRVPSRAGRGLEDRQTVHWSSLAAPPEARAACAEVRRELSKSQPDLTRAQRFLDRALQLEPKMAEAWELLGVVEKARGNRGSARSAFEEALHLDSGSYESHTFLAELDSREQRWAKALEHCNRALAIEPNCLRAHYLKAFAAYYVGDFADARTASRQIHASGQDVRYADIDVIDALLLAQAGRTSEAASLLSRFIARHPAYGNRRALEYQLGLWRDSGSKPKP